MDVSSGKIVAVIKKLAVAGLLATAVCGSAFAEGMTKEQGDAILSELRQIRQLLGRQQGPQQAPAPQAAPERVKLILGNEFSVGRSDAPVVMVEYTDYQCPFCNRFYTGTFPELKKQYIDTGKVRFITRDFPLEFHPHAVKAAQAAHCAGEQDKFWQMKDALMTNSPQLNAEFINGLAGKIGLDTGKFKACMDSGRYVEQIRQEETTAKGLGITGTPSFVIGRVSGNILEGDLVVGAMPLPAFEGAINKVLSEKK